MACAVRRRGKWVANWRDGAGQRRARFFETKRTAEEFLGQAIGESRQATRPEIDPNITLAGWVAQLPSIRSTTRAGAGVVTEW